MCVHLLGVPTKTNRVNLRVADRDAELFRRAAGLRHGLAPSPTDERHLMIMLKDIRAVLVKRHQSA